jgi:Amt family ammonium transporter
VLSVIGASLLWVGWFGFNAGSATAANANAGMAMAVTQIASATAALAGISPSGSSRVSQRARHYLGCRRQTGRDHSGIGFRRSALIIGIAAGIVCYWVPLGSSMRSV